MTHVDIDVTISAAENMIDVDYRGGDSTTSRSQRVGIVQLSLPLIQIRAIHGSYHPFG